MYAHLILTHSVSFETTISY